MSILYILASYNIYGGTPKKTLDLLEHLKEDASLYMYGDDFSEFKYRFKESGANLYEGYYKRNIYLHIQKLLSIIDTQEIKIIQTQFSFGELLGVILKKIRPKVQLIVSFETAFVPSGIRRYILAPLYSSVDEFIYISNYVKEEKEKSFPSLKNRNTTIIHNGTRKREVTEDECPQLNSFSLLDVAGLNPAKNLYVLIRMMNILVNTYQKNIYLYIAGEGPEDIPLMKEIKKYSLEKYVHLLGNQKNVGQLLESSDIFVHSSDREGFGIVVIEAMMAEKPIIVANAGALPEIIDNNKTGLIVDAYDASVWAKAVLKLMNNKEIAQELASNAKKYVEDTFSIENYINKHLQLYKKLMDRL